MKKKIAAVIFTLTIAMTVFPLNVSALNKIITNLTASYSDTEDKINVCGNSDALAVAVGVYNSSGDTLYLESTAVNNGSFSYEFLNVTLASGTYTVKAADYDGGAFATTEFTVTADTVQSATEPFTTSNTTPNPNKKAYSFIDGADGEWLSDSGEGLEFRIDGELKNLLKVKVDRKTLDKSDYLTKSGSTIIILKPEYLKTLDAGQHTLTVVFRGGSVTTSFRVIEYDDIAAGEGIEAEEEIIPDDEITTTDNNAKPQEEKSVEVTSVSENPATGNSLSGVFAVAMLAITVAGFAYKKREK